MDRPQTRFADGIVAGLNVMGKEKVFICLFSFFAGVSTWCKYEKEKKTRVLF